MQTLGISAGNSLINCFDAKFNYRPLIWMLHSCWNNKKIKHLQER